MNDCLQVCREYGYPWIYPWIYTCVDIRLKPSCGYIYGYYAGAPANQNEYLYSLSLYDILLVCHFYSSFFRLFILLSHYDIITSFC